ncbi:MAG: TetR family transcriptional regulator [Mycolicibacter algericus]|uniref:TetR family transcriptional regulator n=1 Tax=Mycolicibacter sinensis (strain JDM601) TaxID=875328 RepID=F5Z0M8_MYCSD|nr:TetR family transcriptional regulator [Mycolicibacter sinensis]AEF34417.1 TetR family transcriptional regulator [Mycolicibacter sinensis]
MSGPEDRILGIVVEILETQGYDAVQLREVARRARVSLATIYKRYVTRDELILAALDSWMAENRYSGVDAYAPEPAEPLYPALMRLYRTIFEPWERHPAMLTAYVRARSAPGGDALVRRGLDVVGPAMRAALSEVDEAFIADLDVIISNLVYGLSARFAAGELAITDILPALDRAVYRLTSGYEAGLAEGS